jgi:hypothetical protein
MPNQIQNRKTKKFVIILMLPVIFILGLLTASYFLRPIGSTELMKVTSKKISGYRTYDETCYKPSSDLRKRCGLFGGEIRAEIAGVGGTAPARTIGCFPKGGTSDKDNYCHSDSDCQGYCIENVWYNARTKSYNDDFCSGYKKPFFVFQENSSVRSHRYVLCGE